ncbi:uncharacterized protein BDZ99DRAFT_457890 [Mytilinidion resinicola]|uniref:Uncharacterized protein n=1 Tax=Mytilinidion resinicola TaxID=574789 RepID=A0A6A6Z6R3_9PEZI|nr:uncharacterized protein BDZ99DRAFT_457890 [Mytilinidion resinicola]KAF2815957.1 hypothetical protein BDZ99DRAFT_457890 [Mytilinidion resinicola]
MYAKPLGVSELYKPPPPPTSRFHQSSFSFDNMDLGKTGLSLDGASSKDVPSCAVTKVTADFCLS